MDKISFFDITDKGMVDDFKIGVFKEDNITYLSLEFKTDAGAIINIPKINLSRLSLKEIILDSEFKWDRSNKKCACFFLGKELDITLPIETIGEKSNKIFFTITFPKDKAREMTIEEIEKELGYSIIIKEEK